MLDRSTATSVRPNSPASTPSGELTNVRESSSQMPNSRSSPPAGPSPTEMTTEPFGLTEPAAASMASSLAASNPSANRAAADSAIASAAIFAWFAARRTSANSSPSHASMMTAGRARMTLIELMPRRRVRVR